MITNAHVHPFDHLCLTSASRQLQIWDTAGQERFRKSMVEHYYRNVHAVVFVYDVTKMNSFRNLQTWIQVSPRRAAPRRRGELGRRNTASLSPATYISRL